MRYSLRQLFPVSGPAISSQSRKAPQRSPPTYNRHHNKYIASISEQFTIIMRELKFKRGQNSKITGFMAGEDSEKRNAVAGMNDVGQSPSQRRLRDHLLRLHSDDHRLGGGRRADRSLVHDLIFLAGKWGWNPAAGFFWNWNSWKQLCERVSSRLLLHGWRANLEVESGPQLVNCG